MKFQLNLIAAMSVLGLGVTLANPAFAEDNATTTTKSKHHQRHHRMKHHAMKHEVAEPRDYKDYKDMAPVQPVCTISPYTVSMDEMTQNVGRAMPNPCNPGWFNRIHVSGGINLDLGKFGKRNTEFMGVNYERFSINDAYLNFSADVNDWVKAFASLSFETATINDPGFGLANGLVSEYSAAYSNNVTSGSSNLIQMEQAFLTIANFNESPIFVQLGKKFQDHSRYMIHPITRSMTQVISETLATSANVGFIYNGFNGSVGVFEDQILRMNHTHKETNYLVSLGFDQNNTDLGFDLGISWLRDMVGVNDVAYIVNQFNPAGYNRRVSSIAVYGDVNSGPFTVGARYTRAMRKFDVMDLPDTLAVGAVADGAKPWAAGIQAGFDFQAMERNHNLYVGWQGSHDSVALMLPKNRWLVGWDMKVWDAAHVGIEFDRDKAYSTSKGASGDSTTLVTLRAGVEFN